MTELDSMRTAPVSQTSRGSAFARAVGVIGCTVLAFLACDWWTSRGIVHLDREAAALSAPATDFPLPSSMTWALVVGLVLAGIGWTFAPGSKGDHRVRWTVGHVLQAVGWVMAGLMLARWSSILSLTGWEIVHQAGFYRPLLESYGIPLLAGLVIGVIGVAVAPRRS